MISVKLRPGLSTAGLVGVSMPADCIAIAKGLSVLVGRNMSLTPPCALVALFAIEPVLAKWPLRQARLLIAILRLRPPMKAPLAAELGMLAYVRAMWKGPAGLDMALLKAWARFEPPKWLEGSRLCTVCGIVLKACLRPTWFTFRPPDGRPLDSASTQSVSPVRQVPATVGDGGIRFRPTNYRCSRVVLFVMVGLENEALPLAWQQCRRGSAGRKSFAQ